MSQLRGGILLAAACAVFALPAAGQGVRSGSRAPNIDLPTLDGSRVRLEDYRGQPVIVTFWASWCPSCRDEFPTLADAYRRYAEQGLKVFAVNELDQEVREEDIRKFLVEVPVPFPVLVDRRGRSRRGEPAALDGIDRDRLRKPRAGRHGAGAGCTGTCHRRQ